jgi:hypothetical protein
MKPNGKYFVVRAVFLALCAVGLLSASGNAETLRGNFKLAAETHWGKMLLAPGEYEFTVNDSVEGKIVTVRSKESGWSGMIMTASSSDLPSSQGSSLLLSKSEDGTYVRALCLSDSGVMLNYGTPKAGKVTKLAKSQPATSTMASAAGGQ